MLRLSLRLSSVQSGSPQFCATQGGFSFDSQTSGFLSSVTAVDTSIGLSQCPWLIEVKKGQRINLTLYSFSTVLDPQMMGRRPSECEWTVVVQEGNLTVQLPGCSLAAREKVIYTTQGGNVKVHLEVSEGIDMSDAANIILKYQGIVMIIIVSSLSLTPYDSSASFSGITTSSLACSYSPPLSNHHVHPYAQSPWRT